MASVTILTLLMVPASVILGGRERPAMSLALATCGMDNAITRTAVRTSLLKSAINVTASATTPISASAAS